MVQVEVKKIRELTELTSLQSGDLTVVERNGTAFGFDLRLQSAVNQKRDADSAAKLAASLSDGELGFLGDQIYEKRASATGADSCTNDLSVDGLIPAGLVTPDHFGAVGDGSNDDTNPVNAAWTYAHSLGGSYGAQTPSAGMPALYIRSGKHYRSDAGLVLTMTATGATIFGDGPSSVLDRIDINAQMHRGAVANLQLIGSTAIGLHLGAVGSDEANESVFSNLTIREKTSYGVHLEKAIKCQFPNLVLTKNQVNLRVDDQFDCTINGAKIVSSVHDNVQVYGGGGELRMIGVQMQNAGFGSTGTGYVNMRLLGTDAATVVENYYSELSISNANVGGRRYAISSIADNGSGKLRVTTSAAHEMAAGYSKAALAGTANYDGTGLDVLAVISSTVLDLDVTYVADEAAGNLEAPGWDLFIEAQDNPQNVNDQYFHGCNINDIKINGGFNLEFYGTRVGKDHLYMDNTVDTHRLFIDASRRGRRAPDTTQDVLIYGPGSNDGWTAFLRLDDDGGFDDEAGLRLVQRAPHAASGVGADGLPVAYTETSIYEDRVEVTVGGVLVADMRDSGVWLGDGVSRGVRVRRAGTAGVNGNYLDMFSQNAGSTPGITAAGADTNVSILMVPKGTGDFIVDGDLRPNSDGNRTLGNSARHFSTAYINEMRTSDGTKFLSGPGSPEGSITAPVGSLYMRTDGGAATTQYVKESGTGNTGWVAK